jgi:hypothetical protein
MKSRRPVNSNVRHLLFLMRATLFTCLLITFSFGLFASPVRSVSKDAGWSPAVNGLQARLTLAEGEKYRATRRFFPYLELKNVRDLVEQMDVNCDRHHLKVELVNKDGEPLQREMPPSSGFSAEIKTIVLPLGSSIKISLEHSSWMSPPKAAAVVTTPSGAWVLDDADNGNVFLRATLSDESSKPYPWRRWYGKIKTPLLKVTWK